MVSALNAASPDDYHLIALLYALRLDLSAEISVIFDILLTRNAPVSPKSGQKCLC
jgi:hypothetical protein